MKTVGIVSPGAMGSAVGAAFSAAGVRVVTTLSGRSPSSGVDTRAGSEGVGMVAWKLSHRRLDSMRAM